jgi:hypothetical protein
MGSKFPCDEIPFASKCHHPDGILGSCGIVSAEREDGPAARAFPARVARLGGARELRWLKFIGASPDGRSAACHLFADCSPADSPLFHR